MLHLHFSNRFEALADDLLSALAAERTEGRIGVFDTQPVIVPSAALRRALTLAVAERQGVCANVEFAFLAEWLWKQVAQVVPQVADTSPFAAPLLTWRVFAAFADASFVAWHPRLDTYLRQADDVMRWELARVVATLLEQYITYRPDWLQAWTEGRPALPRAIRSAVAAEDEAWQSALWCRIAQELAAGAVHPGQVFVNALARADDATLALPASVHVFGLPSTPPLYIPWLQKLGQRTEVHLYLLNPCQEYWYEVVDPRRLAHLQAKTARTSGGKGRPPASSTTRPGAPGHHEVGNRLLAAWGRQTQAHIDLLMEHLAEAEEHARFLPNEGASARTLLGRLQDAILVLEDLPARSVAPAEDTSGEPSLQVHVCHSLTRELEVLHDRLLAMFAADASLKPSDVLVVTPDVQAAAPLIEAVFATVPASRRIPFAVTGLQRSTTNEVSRLLLRLLSVAVSRCPVTEVFGLLQQAPLARRFGLDGADVDAVHEWLLAAGVRWGLDEEHRQALGRFTDPADPARHTFVDGLDHLFLGYALPHEPDLVFDAGARTQRPLLPLGNAEGQQALVLGRLAAFVQALQQLRRDLQGERSTEDWVAVLLRTLDRFIDLRGDNGSPGVNPAATLRAERQALQDDLGELQRSVQLAGQAALRLPIAVVRAALEGLMDDPARGGVPTGAVTFTAMGTLRGLPYRVVCMIGMNDGAFPTATRPLEFDLMTHAPRRGDRQRRLDERNLFLDLLTSARERVHLSYTGRSLRDNAPLPPSVLVAELLDVALPALAFDATPQALARARSRLVVEHPLQAFSTTVFLEGEDPRVRSHDDTLCAALSSALHAKAADAGRRRARAAQARDLHALEAGDHAGDDAGEPETDPADALAPPFFPGPLPPPGEDASESEGERSVVDLAQLVEFFRNPCRHLLRRRLGLALQRDESSLEDAEVFLADGWTLGALDERLLPAVMAGQPRDTLLRLAEAGAELPPGPVGRVQLDNELSDLQRFRRVAAPALAPGRLPPLAVSLSLEVEGRQVTVQAGIADLRAAGLVREKFRKVHAVDRLEAWLHHLVLSAAEALPTGSTTRWILRDAQLRFAPLDSAAALRHLAELVSLYQRGARAPLPFFPRSAWAFVADGDDLRSAQAEWRSSRFRRGEDADPAHRLALRGVVDPLDEHFIALAHAVFDPVLQCIHERDLDDEDDEDPAGVGAEARSPVRTPVDGEAST